LGDYPLIYLGSACVPLKNSTPSFDEKKPAHLGHLTIVSFVSFDVPWVVHEHPEQNNDMTAIMQKIASQLRIGTIPSFLFDSSFSIMREICRSINSSEKLSRASLQHVLTVSWACRDKAKDKIIRRGRSLFRDARISTLVVYYRKKRHGVAN
jgi:hypothetical protein